MAIVNKNKQTYIGNKSTAQSLARRYGVGNVFTQGGKTFFRGTLDGARNGPSAPTTAATDPQADLIKQIVSSLYPQTTPPPSFENSGLYNEADTLAQAHADYDPTFALQQQQLVQSQQQAKGQQLSDYYNRGLANSGALSNAQNYLQGQQTYGTNDLQQQQKATIAGVKASAYQNAFNRYLNQFNTK